MRTLCTICGGRLRPGLDGTAWESQQQADYDSGWFHRECRRLLETGQPVVRRDDPLARPRNRHRHRRDSQRGRLYKAERTVWRTGRMAEKLPEIPDIQAWVDRIVGSRWWAKYVAASTYPEGWQASARRYRHVRVLPGSGCRRALGSTAGWIKLPRWSRFRAVILHELAHVIATERPAHGPQFAAIYLALVRRWCGRAEHDALRAAFRAARVKYGGYKRSARKTGRTWTPEEKAAWRAKLEAGKAAKKARLTAAAGQGNMEHGTTMGEAGGTAQQ